MVKLRIRFSIPMPNGEKVIKEQLRKFNFLAESIKPEDPNSQEIAAYILTGTFCGEWSDIFPKFLESCRAANMDVVIQEDD